MVIAALPWEANQGLVDYLKTQVEKLPIDVELKQEVTPDFIRHLNPDTIVIAVGSKRTAPPIPGIKGNNVISGDDFRQIFTGHPKEETSKKLSILQRLMIYAGRAFLEEFYDPELLRKMTKRVFPVGGKKVVILGGELVGCELADFLSERGREITVIEQGDALATEMSIPRRARVLHTIRERGVKLITGVNVEEIMDGSITIVDREGNKQTIEMDTVFLATPVQPNTELSDEIQGGSWETLSAGDCVELRLIKGSIADGINVGMTI